MNANALEKAKRYWNAVPLPQNKITRFWEHPRIHTHINEIVCGESVSGHSTGFMRRLKASIEGGFFNKGISVGCGAALLEMVMLEDGLVREFDLFELSDVRIQQGTALAEKRNLASRIRYYESDFDKTARIGHYDLVLWNSSLHHTFDVFKAVGWSRDVLRPGGVFAMDDFVGPSRFQWTDFNLEIASMVRSAFPNRLLIDPHDSTKTIPTNITRPTISYMIEIDPSEAADSDRILPAIQCYFDDADIIFTGGAIYHLALNDVLANMTLEDAPLLEQCLIIDKLCSDLGTSHFAVVIAKKL